LHKSHNTHITQLLTQDFVHSDFHPESDKKQRKRNAVEVIHF